MHQESPQIFAGFVYTKEVDAHQNSYFRFPDNLWSHLSPSKPLSPPGTLGSLSSLKDHWL